ncbi:DUF5615 family PIN-like protein [candidate division CSSED10-310 bacterium]|uniref:DUF5615 family PIN-like protein n=1 Tax=candidate division CSSED10-310 bacterium TaxID=2855610 RepID=A0ABV6Z0J3_UNCC1
MSQKIKFYADENVPRAVVEGLRKRGLDVLTPHDTGMLGKSDEEQLVFALNQKRVILTRDQDFLRLHSRAFNHCGIIYTSHKKSIGDIIQGMLLIYSVFDADEMKNHVEFL